jgi:hypothetical protein
MKTLKLMSKYPAGGVTTSAIARDYEQGKVIIITGKDYMKKYPSDSKELAGYDIFVTRDGSELPGMCSRRYCINAGVYTEPGTTSNLLVLCDVK